MVGSGLPSRWTAGVGFHRRCASGIVRYRGCREAVGSYPGGGFRRGAGDLWKGGRALVIFGFNLIDLLVVVLVLVVGYTGWTHGLVVGLLSFVGFVGGAAAGLLLVPRILGGLDP